MKRYRESYLFATVVISFPCALLIAVNTINANVGRAVSFAAFLTLWWGLYWALLKEKAYAVCLSLVVVAVFWVLLLLLTLRRMAFVLTNNSLEGPQGLGSPAAFFVGLFFEQAFFIPLSVVLVSGFVGLAKGELRFWPLTRQSV